MVIRIQIKNKEVILNVQDIVSIFLDKDSDSSKSQGPTNPAIKKRKQIGTKTHTTWQSQQQNKFKSNFKKEFFIKSKINYNDWKFLVRGRLDGLMHDQNDKNGTVYIEEIKSTFDTIKLFKRKNDQLEYLKNNYYHYLLQLQIYLYLLKLQDDYQNKKIIGKLIFINIRNQKNYSFIIEPENQIKLVIHSSFDKILENLHDQVEQTISENEALEHLTFPYETSRKYQEQIINDVHNVFEKNLNFGVCAPTGLGKTISVIFPALKYALKYNKKIFYSTAKNSQQEIVYKTIIHLQEKLPKNVQNLLSTVFIVAKEQMCINEEFICHESSCSYLENYSNKLNIEEIVKEQENLKFGSLFTVETLKRIGKKKKLCPFELGLDLSLDAKIMVGDYNYVFDPRVFLRRHFEEYNKEKEFILIVDEAHNLPGRVKQYFTVDIEPRYLQSIYQKIEPGSKFRLWFQIFWNLIKTEFDKYIPSESPQISALDKKALKKSIKNFNLLADSYFMKLLINKISLNKEDPILSLYYFLIKLESAIDILPPDSVHIVYNPIKKGDFDKKLRILCLDASFWIKKKVKQFHSTIFVSATLVPTVFYSKLFGLKEIKIEVYPSPFPSENRRLMILKEVETQYRKRKSSINKLAEILTFISRISPRKVLIFFSSYDYLFLFLKQLKYSEYPNLRRKIYVISKDVSSHNFKSVLTSIKERRNIKLVITVLGSIIGESIEFPERMLDGLIIIGPGYPTVDFELNLGKNYYEDQGLSGNKYSIQFPAISRVVQALGRLIRSETDKGFMLLIGNQYAENYYRYLPRYLYDHIEDVFPSNSWQEILKSFVKENN